jgi:Ca-activated chloride channel homolog
MCTVATLATAIGIQPATATVAVAQTPSFRAAVDVVSVTAVVRDSRGRPVNNLGREDFQVYERGRLRQIVQFKASDQGPISLGILFDVSGSMRGATQMQAGQRAVEHILSWVNPAQDEVGLFSFDAELRKEVDFTTDLAKVKTAVNGLTAVGQTSLYDAINKTAAALGDRPSPRRAVIVITDGIDTSSKLTPAQVSGMASAIDVPVYVIAVLSPLDHPGQDFAVVGAETSPVATQLSNLSYWTGGTLFMVSAPAHASQAARDLITELRHQYLIAFEAAREPGWYELDVRTRRRELTVRARSGYFSQSRQG